MLASVSATVSTSTSHSSAPLVTYSSPCHSAPQTIRAVDCRDLSKRILSRVRERIVSGGLRPRLDIVRSSNRPDSDVYIRLKTRELAKVGIECVVHDWSGAEKAACFMKHLRELNCNAQVSAILVQFPLGHAAVSAAEVMETIDPKKDVDGFHPLNMARLLETPAAGKAKHDINKDAAIDTPVDGSSRTDMFFESCTARGVMQLLAELGVKLAGERVCVVGRSRVVGWPLTHMLLAAGATVTVCHSQTRQLPKVLQAHGIVVVAIGQPRYIQASWIRPGAVVIDVGINEDPKGSGRPVGDVDYDAVRSVAAYVTPVPGGVGPLTVAMLAENVLQAAEAHSRT